MRTTVVLDTDVAAAVSHLREQRGMGLSEAVNELARRGLSAPAPRSPFRQRTRRLGVQVDVSNVAETLEELDGPLVR